MGLARNTWSVVGAALLWAATAGLLVAQHSQLTAEVRAVREEGADLRRQLLQLRQQRGEAPAPFPSSLSSGGEARREGRALLATTAGSDAVSHVSSDGTATLSISSDVAVDVASVRFGGGAAIGVAADTDLIALASGEVTVSGGLSVTGAVSVSAPVFARGYGALSGTYSSSGQTLVSSTYDANGVSVSSGGSWTVPVTAKYRVTGYVLYQFSSAGEANRYTSLQLWDTTNSAVVQRSNQRLQHVGGSASYSDPGFTVIVDLDSSATYEFQTLWDATMDTPTVMTPAGHSYFAIEYFSET